jgi:glycosyltransferase involved in cell wall biosynthesis
MSRLTAIILTYNEAEHIQLCIETLAFADDILVFDSFSTDSTVALAQKMGVRVEQRTFDDYASQRNAALDSVADSAEWVLFVDADERATPDLAAKIHSAMNKPDYAAWRVPRHNYLLGRLTMGAGWYPDYQTRLLRVGHAHYDPSRKVHELVILDGPEGTLSEHLVHYNYRDIQQFHKKQRQYSTYDAQIMYEQGIHPKLHNYILQPLRQFRWRFLELGGYKDGWHGFRLSALMAWYEWVKYRKLRTLWRTKAQIKTG